MGCGHSSVPCLRPPILPPCHHSVDLGTPVSWLSSHSTGPLLPTWPWRESWRLDPSSFPCTSSQSHRDHPPAFDGLAGFSLRSVLTLCACSPTHEGSDSRMEVLTPPTQLLQPQPPNQTKKKAPVLPPILSFYHLGNGTPMQGLPLGGLALVLISTVPALPLVLSKPPHAASKGCLEAGASTAASDHPPLLNTLCWTPLFSEEIPQLWPGPSSPPAVSPPPPLPAKVTAQLGPAPFCPGPQSASSLP